MTSLSILIATYNRLSQLKVVLASIQRETLISHQIYVIDGGSTDGTIEYLSRIKEIIPIFQGKLLGPACAYNEVWRTIDTKYTCWLSDDTEIVNGCLDTAVQILDENPDIGMVGLKMRDTMGPWSEEPFLGSISILGILNCNHGVMRTCELNQVGFFNESYKFYMIDPDLTASFLSIGKKVVITKEIAVLHHRKWTLCEKDEFKHLNNKLYNQKIYAEKFSYLMNNKKSVINHYFYSLLKYFLHSIPNKKFLFKSLKNSYLNYSLLNDWESDCGYLLKIRIYILLLQIESCLIGSDIVSKSQKKYLYNIFMGRHISILDFIVTWRKPFHLIQKIPSSIINI